MRALLSLVLTASTMAQQAPPHPGVLMSGTTTVQFASIDPANEDFSDLEPLRDIIGDARVVVLGEQSHGDGAVFLCKARLVKFLHQQMDFDVLCWESGMIGCELMNERIADSTIPINDAFDGVFPIWTLSAQVLPTMEYARATHATDRPLLQAGFDAQLTSPRIGDALALRLDAMTDVVDAPDHVRETSGTVRDVLGRRTERTAETMKSLRAQLDALTQWMDDHRVALDAELGKAEVDLTRRVFDDAAWFVGMMAFSLDGGTPEDDMDIYNERDRRMGDNLVFLANERFAGRKMIVWAATRHMVHRQKEIAFPDMPGLYDDMDSAGETAFDRLGDDLYTIGFTALRGRAGNCFRDVASTLEEPREGSIEWALDAVEHPFLFVDFRSLPEDHPLRGVQTMRPLGYGWMNAVWPEQMDAVICIETMFKSDRNVYVPDGYALTVE